MRTHASVRTRKIGSAWQTVVLVSLFASLAGGYGTNEHADITTKAISNYMQWARRNPGAPGSGGIDALERYGGRIVKGSRDEDSMWPNPLPWREHYMDPVTGKGVTCAGIKFGSAYKRVRDENHWPYALAAYQAGEYVDAFWTLGRVIHLVEDMAVPAHVQLDVHIYREWYEKEYMAGRFVDCAEIGGFDDPWDFRSIMWTLAAVADQFDSDGDRGICKGTTTKVNANDGWTEDEGRLITSECYVGAIHAAGRVLRKFFATVEPAAELIEPDGQATYRGGDAIPLEAKARSFRRSPADAVCIDRVEFYYCPADNPLPSDWIRAGVQVSPISGATGLRYGGTWQNPVDKGKLHLRAVVYDRGGCRSCLGSTLCQGVTTIENDNP